ncbi:hypothetical protein GCM10023349_03750 [Nocardioides conyzicola]|uniref:Uncharacterized protein n=1 Tax=Nocardioides conyzicola TaxID=1651781 RepID=A0ABP8WMQ3_9ACTN
MGRPSPLPPPRGRTRSARWNRSNTRSRSSGDARTVVDDVEAGLVVVDVDNQDDLCCRVGHRVLQQVADDPPYVVGVRQRRRRGDLVRADPYAGAGPGADGLLQDERVEVERGRPSDRVRIDRGQHEEVTHQPFHVARRSEDVRAQPVGVDVLGPGEGELEGDALRGERALQIVGDVGDEVALVLRGSVEPPQHRVHGRGQTADLVGHAVTGHPGVQVLRGDPVHLGSDAVQPSERPAEEQPDHDAERQCHERHAHGQRPA